jgi:hypothetical protein
MTPSLRSWSARVPRLTELNAQSESKQLIHSVLFDGSCWPLRSSIVAVVTFS